jgi:hypothetical protein
MSRSITFSKIYDDNYELIEMSKTVMDSEVLTCVALGNSFLKVVTKDGLFFIEDTEAYKINGNLLLD